MPKQQALNSSRDQKPQVSITSLVDDLGQLQQDMRLLIPDEIKAKLKVLAKKEEDLKSKLLAQAKPPADEETIFEGANYYAVISPAANQRTIIVPMTKLAKLVDQENGKGAFMENCSFTLKAAEECLPVAILETIIKTERTGRRAIDTARKATREWQSAA